MSQISEHSEFCNISPPLTAQSAAGGQGCERLAFPAEVCYNGCKKNVRRDVVLIAITNASLPSKKRILTVCVKLFLEQGYKKTTVAQIVQQASVSNSIFQNIFRAKDGVLAELVEFMFSNQFATARSMAGAQLPPAYVYAVETAIQMTLTELNENLREIYIEAYTQKEASEYILRETAKELFGIFGPYQPELTLEKKLRLFLMMSLRAYHVPEAEIVQAVAFIEGLNMSFDDAFDVSGYAVPAMQWACGAGVMQGANGKLLPTAEATRAQTAAMLHRFCEDVLK